VQRRELRSNEVPEAADLAGSIALKLCRPSVVRLVDLGPIRLEMTGKARRLIISTEIPQVLSRAQASKLQRKLARHRHVEPLDSRLWRLTRFSNFGIQSHRRRIFEVLTDVIDSTHRKDHWTIKFK
jgi:hypothetical protein